MKSWKILISQNLAKILTENCFVFLFFEERLFMVFLIALEKTLFENFEKNPDILHYQILIPFNFC